LQSSSTPIIWQSRSKKNQRHSEGEEGSDNVFADLKDTKLKQHEISSLLGIAQPEVSHLMDGHCSRCTADKLPDFLKRLDRKVTIRSPRSRSYVSASGNVRLALGQVCAMPFDYLEQFRIFDVPEGVVAEVFG
jgi:hypothetical protein